MKPLLDASPAGGAIIGVHGSTRLPAVDVDGYNIELRDNDGFVGDRVSKKAFYALLDKWRKTVRKDAPDPLGKRKSDKISKRQLDALLAVDDPIAAGLVHSVVEEFAQEFAGVVTEFLKVKEWKGTQRIVVGGGMRSRQIGTLVQGRADLLLKSGEVPVELVPIRNDPDDAGLIGAVHLVPPWIFEGRNAIVAVDIGGTNMRVGIVKLNLRKGADLSKVAVWRRKVWRHRDQKTTRDDAIEQLANLIKGLVAAAAKARLNLAPFIGVGCPGRIEGDGSIASGAQNLPGNWESNRFNLPNDLKAAIPKIGDHETQVLMHNDAVVQGLSEVPFMQDVKHWATLTLGTGLGNVRFTNRQSTDE